MIDEEKFFAWLDGELDPKEARRVAEQVEADPALAALASRHRAMAKSLHAAFDPTLANAPPPPSVDEQTVVRLSKRRKMLVKPWRRLQHWPAMAAMLVTGLVAGILVRPESDDPIVQRGGSLFAAAALRQALETQLASDEQTGPVRIGLTFRDRGGSVCRSFSGETGRGLACRNADGWKIEGIFAPSDLETGDYRMASGQEPLLADMIDERIEGDPMGAEAVSQARESGWR